MCIRDSVGTSRPQHFDEPEIEPASTMHGQAGRLVDQQQICLLYTSDAADERSSVDLGGRRIIKKKKRAVDDGVVNVSIISRRWYVIA